MVHGGNEATVAACRKLYSSRMLYAGPLTLTLYVPSPFDYHSAVAFAKLPLLSSAVGVSARTAVVPKIAVLHGYIGRSVGGPEWYCVIR
jgi:hypothetical protein